MRLHYHHPFSFSWPWPTTEEVQADDDWLCEQHQVQSSNGSGSERRGTQVEEVAERIVVANDRSTPRISRFAHHRKRRRRMPPVLSSPSRTNIVARQVSTTASPINVSLSVTLPIPTPTGDGGEDGGSGGGDGSGGGGSSETGVSSSSSSFTPTPSVSSTSLSLSLSSSSSSFTSYSSFSRSSTISSSSSTRSSSSFSSSSTISSSSITSSISSSSSSFSSSTSSSSIVSSSSSSSSSSRSLSLSSPSSSRTPPSTTPSTFSSPPPLTTSLPISTRFLTTSSYLSSASISVAIIPLAINSSIRSSTPITTLLLPSISRTSLSSSAISSSSRPTASVLSEDEGNPLARNKGAIIGISVAAFLALLTLIIFLFFLFRTKRRLRSDSGFWTDNEHTVSGRMSALRALLGASPSIGRSTSSSLTGSTRVGFGHSAESGLPEARPVMLANPSSSGISLGSQLSLEQVADSGGNRLSLGEAVDGNGSIGLGVGGMTHVGNGSPVALASGVAIGGGVAARDGIGIAMTTNESRAAATAAGSTAPTVFATSGGLTRSTSGRSPILYHPSTSQSVPPSSYHRKATSPALIGYPALTTPQSTRISPVAPSSRHSHESAMSPSSEGLGLTNGYNVLASSSGHGHGMSSSSDMHSEASSGDASASGKTKYLGRPSSFAAAFANLGRGKNSGGSNESSSSDASVKRSFKGKDKEIDFGFLGRFKSGSGKEKRGSRSSFGRGFGKNPVHVGMPVSGMSFTASAPDSDRGNSYDGGPGTRVRPSSLLNPPNPPSVPSPIDSSFAYHQIASPPNVYASPSFSPSQYYAISTPELESPEGGAPIPPSMIVIPPTPPQQRSNPPSASGSRPTSPTIKSSPLVTTTNTSSSLPTARAKRGRSQLYISNDTRWAESIADSFYGGDSVEDYTHNYASQPSQEVIAQDSSSPHSPHSPLSQYSQQSATTSQAIHANLASQPTNHPFARPTHMFSNSQSSDRGSFASNGSNGTDNSSSGVPEGLLRPDLRTFVLGLRTREGQDGTYRLAEADERRGEWDGASVGSLRDHVDYSRPIGALINNHMPSTTTFNSDPES